MIQDLNPALWGPLALLVDAGAPGDLIGPGPGWRAGCSWVWLSSFGGLFVLFLAQCVAASCRRQG